MLCTRLLLPLWLCLSLLLMPAGAEARRVALVIGNAAYKETAPLSNTRNDANDVAAALNRLQFDVLLGVDLDKRDMERLIRQFEQKLAGAEIALFFYAGHGLQIAGQNHMVPVDARLAAEGDIDFESLPLSLVLTRMEREAKTSLVLLDACRDNPLARNLARTMGTRSAVLRQGLAEVKTGVGTLISFSTQPGNVALDGDGRNSPYTAALLKEIERPGRDFLSSLAAVRGAVLAATKGKQVPWEHTSLLGPVYLNDGPPASTSVPAPNPGTASAAAEAWGSVKDTTSTADLEAFVRRFGDTFYGDLARSRLAELTKARAAPPPAAPPLGPKSSAALSCSSVLAFLQETGAFGSKPLREAAYADRVTYYKQGQIARAEVIRTAQDYERRYPSRLYEIDSKTVVIRETPPDACQVRFEYGYSARNATEERSGRGWAEYAVKRRGDRFEITAESGDVITRQVRKLQ
ncbi:MAG: caspase domain-containing protein [Hyphomicrobiaceae bacterium]